MAGRRSHVDFLNEVTDTSANQEAGAGGKRKSKGALTAKEKQFVLDQYVKSAKGDEGGAEALTRAFLDVKVKREEEKKRANELKANQVFKELLESVESEELRDALEQECRNFSRRMSAMDQEVERKVSEVRESDQQHDMLTQAFDKTMSTLKDCQEDSVNRVIHDYNSNLEHLLSSYNLELDDNTEKHRDKMAQLTDCMFALDSKFKEPENDVAQQQKTLEKFMELQGIRESQNLRIASESLIEDYWRQYEESLYNFNTETRKLKSELAKRRRIDKGNSQMYQNQQERVERLQTNLKAVKNKVRSINRETANTLNAISREQKVLFGYYVKLRQVLKENEKVKDMQLVKLCTDSENALRSLRNSLDMAERIIKLGHMCRALESEKEKVVPFLNEEHLNPVEAQVVHEKMWTNFEQPLNKDVHLYSRVSKLEQRISKAALDDATIRAEIHQYDKAIDWLKKQLKLYLEDVSVTSEFDEFDDCNQLLKVNRLDTNFQPNNSRFFDVSLHSEQRDEIHPD